MMMRRAAPFALILALAATPTLSQEADPDAPGAIERGLGAIIGQLFGDEEPGSGDALPDGQDLTEDLSGALRQMGPVLRDLAAQVDDMRHYQAPERLPNGDILMRRREGAPPPPPPVEAAPSDEPPAAPSDLPQIAL